MKGKFMIKPKYGSIENKKRNMELLRKYPFLRPSPLFVKSTVLRYKKYDYSFTIVDFIYPGYLESFAYDFFDELRNKLLETDDIYLYLIWLRFFHINLYRSLIKTNLIFYLKFFHHLILPLKEIH